MKILNNTQKILMGNFSESTLPIETGKLIWEFNAKLWPECREKTPNGRGTHHDAEEYLERLIEECEDADITEALKTTVRCSAKCNNIECEEQAKEKLEVEKILKTFEIPDNAKISLQTIIENFVPRLA